MYTVKIEIVFKSEWSFIKIKSIDKIFKKMKFSFALLGLAFGNETQQPCTGKDTKLIKWIIYTAFRVLLKNRVIEDHVFTSYRGLTADRQRAVSVVPITRTKIMINHDNYFLYLSTKHELSTKAACFRRVIKFLA